MSKMIDRTLSLFAPHICKGCNATGEALCERCIFHILGKKYDRCVGCETHLVAGDLTKRGNLCLKCVKSSPFSRAIVVGARRGGLRRLVGDFKYNSERGAAKVVAHLLDRSLPAKIPNGFIVVPITTISKNVRRRGFDHMKLVAKNLAKQRGLTVKTEILKRTNNVTQHSQKTVIERRQSAEKSFAINPRAQIPARILLLDDIYTTGATVETAAKLLKKNGAKEIWLLIVARQPSRE